MEEDLNNVARKLGNFEVGNGRMVNPVPLHSQISDGGQEESTSK